MLQNDGLTLFLHKFSSVNPEFNEKPGQKEAREVATIPGRPGGVLYYIARFTQPGFFVDAGSTDPEAPVRHYMHAHS